MVKENKLKLISPTLSTKTKPMPVTRSTVSSSVVISIIIIASISAIGITIAYMISHFSTTPATPLDIKSKCISSIIGFEEKGYYPNVDAYKAASASCIK